MRTRPLQSVFALLLACAVGFLFVATPANAESEEKNEEETTEEQAEETKEEKAARKAEEKQKKKTAKRRSVLLTEYDDARVGKSNAAAVAAQIGVMDDEEIHAYVNAIGSKLLRGVPRRGFDYQFAVVDQVEPNAFALPGGYIFISRGLLALANSEDELACVIGHEITHAAHRHSAAQQEISKRTPAMGYWKQGQMAKYGRDMERDADHGGQILCAAAGYDPMGMSTFLENLGMFVRLQVGYEPGPSFFDSHPGSTERAAVNAVRAREIRWTRDPNLGDTHASLLKMIDGLPVGQRPEGGVFVGNQFLHPDLDFQLYFPRGWRKSNTNMAVGATAPRGEAVVFLKAEMPEGDPKQRAEEWFAKSSEQQKMHLLESKPTKVGHIDAWRLKFETSGGGMSVSAFVTFIPYNDLTWTVTGMAPSREEKAYLGRTLATARSFRPLTEEERNLVMGLRLRLATAESGEGLEALGNRTDNGWKVPEMAVYNAVFYDHLYEGGELVKITHREGYTPPPPPAEAPPGEDATAQPPASE